MGSNARLLRFSPALGLLAALAVAGCGSTKPVKGDGGPDAKPSAGDAQVERADQRDAKASEPEAVPDVSPDGAPESVEPDAAAEVAPEAPPEAPVDVGAETPVDEAVDAPADLAPTDGGVDAPETTTDARTDACLACGPRTSVALNGWRLVLDRKGNRLFTTVGDYAESDDGTTLWVGIDEAGSVRRVDLTTEPPTPGTSFALPNDDPFLGKVYARSMVVLWGTKATLAVSMMNLAHQGVAIFDDGVARANRTPPNTGPSQLVRGEPGWLFGYNDRDTGYGFFSLPVTATGVTQTQGGPVITGFESRIVYGGERVYSTEGQVVDVTTPTIPGRVGIFKDKGAIVPVPTKNRAWMVSPAASADKKAVLRLLDTELVTQIDSVELDDVDATEAMDLVQPSDTLLAFLARGGTAGTRVVFVPIAPLP